MACDLAIEQLGLFDTETSHLAAARRALSRFDLDGAEAALASHLAIFGADRSARTLSDVVRRLRARRNAARRSCTEIEALVELRGEVPAELLPAWHLRVGELAEHAIGEAYIAGEPIGFHFLAAGQPSRAIEISRTMLAASPGDAHVRMVLADALHLSDEKDAARREYFRALVDDPISVPFERIADPAVLHLAALAPHEYELGEPVAAWMPAVGIVERIFALPQPRLRSLEPELPESPAPRMFVELIARERGCRSLDERVVVRRRMKALAPLLFDAYLRAYA
jgi:hypothetical protein